MYFDETNNYFNIYNDEDNNIDFIVRDNKLFSIDEGFNKGNMFENTYSKYKNYSYKLKTNNQKDNLLYDIQKYSFALKDLNLYLDTHPSDESMLTKFQEINRRLNELKEKYEKNYSPITLSSIDNETKWTWLNNPWPWDKGGN